MYRSGEAREFAAKLADAVENYARLGGDVNALDKKFLALDSDNLRVFMPKSLDYLGLDSALRQATRDLKASVRPGRSAESRREALRWASVYDKGYWIFDGADGCAFVDAGTGKAVTRRSLADLRSMGASMYEEGLD
jgi:hypothetical protein